MGKALIRREEIRREDNERLVALMSTTMPDLPGRLGDPARLMKTDPRADPRMVAVLATIGLDGARS